MTVWVALLTAALLAVRAAGQTAPPVALPPAVSGDTVPAGPTPRSELPAVADLPSAPEATSGLRPGSELAGGQDLLQHARGLVQAGDFAGAEQELMAELAGRRPGSADALFLLGYVQFRQRKCTKSLKSYTAGAVLRRPSPDDLLVVASDYVQLGDYADAARWLTVVTAEAPANPTAWYLLGRAQYMQDHAAEALAAFQRCLELRPLDVRAKYNQALALERLQRPAEAVAAYRKAIGWAESSGLRDPQPYLDLGTLLLAEGRAAESIVLLRQAADRGAGNAMCFQQLGRALEADGQTDPALAAYHQAAALAPAAQRPHYFLGRLLRRLGRTQEADVEFAAVSRLYGDKSSTETPNPDMQP